MDDAFIKEYMTSHRQVQTVTREIAEGYIHQARLNQTIIDDMVEEEGNVRVILNQSYSQFSGTRSALAYLFKRASITRPPETIKEMEKFMAGIKRTTSNEKRALGLNISEGKKPMSKDAYGLIAKFLFTSGAPEDIEAHFILLLDWNLIKRAENLMHAEIAHME